MDYKRIIKSQELRLNILKLTEWIPDKLMVKLQYKIATGNRLNLRNPKRFSEKIQWYKLYYRRPLMTQCADKYEVRQYIKDRGYEDILVPLYGVYDDVEKIDFDKLPSKFVIKTSNGSHTNILCSNKDELDLISTRNTLNHWMKKRSIKAGREWAYYDIKPRIVCEKYLEKDENNDLVDYKFFCFNGSVHYLEICKERFSDTGLKKGFYTKDFKYIDIGIEEYNLINIESIVKPNNYDEMIQIAEDLSKDFPHVRVDLYNINGKIYFGELTFYHASGYKDYKGFDFMMGEKFDIEFAKRGF